MVSFFKLCGAAFALAQAAHLPVELTDRNFDHDTQIGTHGTTGPWFVKFYAPWCGHCRRMEGAWNDLADQTHGALNVGSVDATKNKQLAKRFKISGYPTLLFFTADKMYHYAGARTIESLSEFALQGGYKNTEGLTIPRPLSTVDMLRAAFVQFVDDFGAVLLDKPAVAYSIAASGISVGLGAGALVTALLMRRHQHTRAKKVD